MTVFSDYDGSYEVHPEIHGSVDAIITGNSWQNSDDIFDNEIDLKIPVFFNPVANKDNNQAKIILWKAEVINRCKVDKFYEDQKQEVDQLRILCPNAKIVWVREGITAI